MRWRVTGIHPVFGVLPGEEFERFIPREQAEALVGGGAIAPAPSKGTVSQNEARSAEGLPPLGPIKGVPLPKSPAPEKE